MNTIWVGCIVEGQSEEMSLPILVRRIAERVVPGVAVQVPWPKRVHRDGIERKLEVAIGLAVNVIAPPGGILIVLDADEDCPARLGPTLLAQARTIRPGISIALALAKHEFENGFIAAAESLRGKRKLPVDLTTPEDPEAIGGAKGWLRRHMPGNQKYAETKDQPALTSLFDMDVARPRSDSFDKCYREIECLLRTLMPLAEEDSKPGEVAD